MNTELAPASTASRRTWRSASPSSPTIGPASSLTIGCFG